MSSKGHHNFFQRAAVTDAIVRSILLRRQDAQFQSDLGHTPFDPELDWYEDEFFGGTDQNVYVPALSDEEWDARMMAQDSQYDPWDDGYDDWRCDQIEMGWERNGQASVDVWAAFNMLEWERTDTATQLWDLHEDLAQPIFLSRVHHNPDRGSW